MLVYKASKLWREIFGVVRISKLIKGVINPGTIAPRA
ncbi:hypothetical protein HPIN_07110 [Helicobacter pylori India7]|uniref:Uncharacterized protein n=1 Tax=Helicobacter pylori (strain India7) TaxID=907238 RepID=E8QDV7_HELP7|nr:hypothetical protein HPIN_07110 [Helicobacter pylori India7]